MKLVIFSFTLLLLRVSQLIYGMVVRDTNGLNLKEKNEIFDTVTVKVGG